MTDPFTALLLQQAKSVGFERAGVVALPKAEADPTNQDPHLTGPGRAPTDQAWDPTDQAWDPTDQGTGSAAFYRRWISAGYHGEMAYLAKPDAVERRVDVRWTLKGARSALVVAHEYGNGGNEGPTDTPSPSHGIVARYARGRDYHKVMKRRLQQLGKWLESESSEAVRWRAYVDTGPLLERDLGRRAGLGWFGRNTMLIHPRRGSYFFLGVLLTDAALTASEPFEADRCGTCRSCLDACPTGALLGRDESGAPVMDARRCISYLTIEHRGPIPHEFREAIGNRIYGCDICQEVCPFNRRFGEEASEAAYSPRAPGERPMGVEAVGGRGPVGGPGPVGGRGGMGRPAGGGGPDGTSKGPALDPHPGTRRPDLISLLNVALSEEAWDDYSRGSAIRRAGRRGFARNVCVGLGNWGKEEGVPVLSRALADPEPIVRAHAAWALGRVSAPEARTALQARLEVERDEAVSLELTTALKYVVNCDELGQR